MLNLSDREDAPHGPAIGIKKVLEGALPGRPLTRIEPLVTSGAILKGPQ